MVEVNSINDITKHIKDINNIIFDLDDTLYSEKEYIRSGLKAVADYLPEVRDAFEKMKYYYELGENPFDQLLIKEGIHTKKLEKACVEIYRKHQPNISLYDGVLETLKNLSSSNKKLGMITDGRPYGQRSKIKALGIEKYFDCIIVTDELGGEKWRKPNDRAFVLMKENLGSSFSDMCYIGDNINKDFIAPQKLGMKSIWFKNKDGLYVV